VVYPPFLVKMCEVLRELWFLFVCLYGLWLCLLFGASVLFQVYAWGLFSLLEKYFWFSFLGFSVPVYSFLFAFGVLWFSFSKSKEKNKIVLRF
jgi:hypothetical protein